MSSRIRRVSVVNRSISPVEADLAVLVEAEEAGADVEVRGWLVGPTCPYATTVEVAYPLRPFPGPEAKAPLSRRVVVPEPSLWDPICPFLYTGVVELWQGAALVDSARVRHGLRSVRLGPGGLLWNGKPLRLRAVDAAGLNPEALPGLRGRGVNTLVLDWPAPALLEAAERLGFAVITRLKAPAEADSVALLAGIEFRIGEGRLFSGATELGELVAG